MITSINPIEEAVQAALWWAKPDTATIGQWEFACHKMIDEVIDRDRDRGFSQLAAAARILADEVVRLREKQQPQNITISYCCEAPAVVAGKPGSTQWYVCPECCEPCDVFKTTTTTHNHNE